MGNRIERSMRVYYFTNAQSAISNVALRRIKISRFEDLNDPFELLAVNLGNGKHRAVFRSAKDALNKKKGVICFTRSWRNPLLWGHYAEKHAGVCLGFDVPAKRAVPVDYSKKLLKIEADRVSGKPKLTEEVVKRLSRTKFFDWHYEDEVRVFVDLEDRVAEAGMYFRPFSKGLILREVILGPRCELPVGTVRKLVANFDPPVTVLKARIAFTRFEVLENRKASRIDANI